MPTTRPRHQITETDDIAAAVETGLQEWPDLSRSEVTCELILKGAESLNLTAVERVLAVESALKELASLLASTGLGLPNCCVLDTARQTSSAVATFDAWLARQATDLGVDLAL